MAAPPVTSDKLLFTNGLILSPASDGTVKRWSWLRTEGGFVKEQGTGEPPVDLQIGAQKVDLGGKVVLPGLGDSHIHIYSLGKHRRNVDLDGCRSIDEMKSRIRRHMEGVPPGQLPVEGTGWDQNLLGRDPTRADLDECVGDRPAVIYRRCFHAATASSAALRFCSALPDVADVEGGVVERDESGGPTGVLREKAIETVLRPLFQLEEPVEAQKETLLSGLMECVRQGVTQVQSNDGKELGNISNPWKLYSELIEEGRLPCRVFLTVPFREVGNGQQPALPAEHPSGLLAFNRVKLWTDGALGAATAALLAPYSDDPEQKNDGVLQLSPEEIGAAVAGAKAKRLRVEAHAIGDRAATHLLEAFEEHLSPSDRPVLTHCQILNEKLVERMAAAGVVANVQPQFVPSDVPIAAARLGEERLSWSYVWKTMMKRGVHVAGGSDAPVEAPAPLIGMADAMDHVMHEGERLTFEEALQIYTVGGAFAAGAEAKFGTLESGMAADLVVLRLGEAMGLESALPTAQALRQAEVREVYVQGRRVHVADDGPPVAVGKPLHEGAGKMGLMRHWRRGRCPCCK